MHFQHFIMKQTQPDVLILTLKMICFSFDTALLSTVKAVNKRKGLDSIQSLSLSRKLFNFKKNENCGFFPLKVLECFSISQVNI